MTSKRWALAVLLLAVVCVGGFGVYRFVARRMPAPAGVPAETVPASWAEYRTSLGHTQHVGKENLTCKSCHDYERDGFKNPGPAPCVACHAKEGAKLHAGGVTKMTDCLTCHAFAPEQKIPTCISCHTEPAGRFAAITSTHATTDCVQCHSPHGDPSVVAKACEGCHTERAPEHAAHAGSAGCGDCHKPHAPAKVALAECSTCHKEPAGPTPAGHDSCIGCHEPHAFVATANVCVGCHGAKDTLVATSVPAHAICTSCHTPHDPANAALSCAGCHAQVKVTHGDKTACITCHTPHSEDVNLKVVACTTCHAAIAPTDTGAHAGSTPCTSCHKPHDFQPATNKLALCASCHAKESTLASSNAGHADCASCHGPSTHQPKAGTACGSCHTKEQASAPKGHQACLGCHQPHSGSHIPTATCASCHADKTGGPHDALKNGCTTCHRAHGPGGIPKPPACATCHADGPLPALHTVLAHKDCATCHSPHKSKVPDRATCTGSCHADRKTHQPQAQVCTGCHAFVK
ncbi:MAG: hypothetical protein ACLQVI_14895 [Polyangiaceae bacterium]